MYLGVQRAWRYQAACDPAGPAPRPERTAAGELQGFGGRIAKGELVGTLPLDRPSETGTAGLRWGYQSLDDVHYALISPIVGLALGPTRRVLLGLGAPLAVEVFDSGVPVVDGLDNAWRLRSEEWDEWSDATRVVRYFRVGRKEERFYLSADDELIASIGHGTITRGYRPDLGNDHHRLSLALDARGDDGGFELLTSDVVTWEVVGGLLFVKPLDNLDVGERVRSLSLGLTAMTDRLAPVAVLDDPPDDHTDPRDGYQTGIASLIGLDVQVDVIDRSRADIKAYIDGSRLLEAGNGGTLGALGRFNVGERAHLAIRSRAEVRLYDPDYQPAYFDAFYAIERVSSLRPADDGAPRLAAVKARTGPPRTGGYGELQLSWAERIAVGTALGAASGPDDGEIALSAEVSAGERLRLAASWGRIGWDTLEELGATEGADRVTAQGRLQLTRLWFVDVRGERIWDYAPADLRYLPRWENRLTTDMVVAF